jgi:hypothetical protein
MQIGCGMDDHVDPREVAGSQILPLTATYSHHWLRGLAAQLASQIAAGTDHHQFHGTNPPVMTA